MTSWLGARDACRLGFSPIGDLDYDSQGLSFSPNSATKLQINVSGQLGRGPFDEIKSRPVLLRMLNIVRLVHTTRPMIPVYRTGRIVLSSRSRKGSFSEKKSKLDCQGTFSFRPLARLMSSGNIHAQGQRPGRSRSKLFNRQYCFPRALDPPGGPEVDFGTLDGLVRS